MRMLWKTCSKNGILGTCILRNNYLETVISLEDRRINYIVLDLEWNQSNTGKENIVSQLPFEIIEMGAIKLNDECVMIDEFCELVKPQVYQEMHHITSKLIHMQMEELERGKPFSKVAKSFLEWCGDEEYIFCTWGCLDLVELQRNMKFYDMTSLSDAPFAFLDVQKLFTMRTAKPEERWNMLWII